MNKVWQLNRKPSKHHVTFGEIYIDGQFECFTLEDEIREIPGQRVIDWKVPGETAIPSGAYGLTLELSPRFGPETITINRVPGFEGVRVHGGNTGKDTEGCVIVGSSIDEANASIHGAKLDDVLNILKAKLAAAIANGDAVVLQINNP